MGTSTQSTGPSSPASWSPPFCLWSPLLGIRSDGTPRAPPRFSRTISRARPTHVLSPAPHPAGSSGSEFDGSGRATAPDLVSSETAARRSMRRQGDTLALFGTVHRGNGAQDPLEVSPRRETHGKDPRPRRRGSPARSPRPVQDRREAYESHRWRRRARMPERYKGEEQLLSEAVGRASHSRASRWARQEASAPDHDPGRHRPAHARKLQRVELEADGRGRPA